MLKFKRLAIKKNLMIVTRIKQICHGLVLQAKTLLKFKTLAKAN